MKIRLSETQRKYLMRANIATLTPETPEQRSICKTLVVKGMLRESDEFPGVYEITEAGERAIKQ